MGLAIAARYGMPRPGRAPAPAPRTSGLGRHGTAVVALKRTGHHAYAARSLLRGGIRSHVIGWGRSPLCEGTDLDLLNLRRSLWGRSPGLWSRAWESL